MAIIIFPTEQDVGVNPGDGRAPTEENLSKWITSIRGPHSRVKRTFKIDTGGVTELTAGGFGFEFVSGVATTVTLGPGDAEILGFEVESDANLVTALTAATYNWVFLQLTRGGIPSKVTGAQLVVTTSSTFENGPGAPPADSILLWCFFTTIAVITTIFDFRSSATDQITGEYLGDGNFSQNIDIGLRPKLVYVVRNEIPRLTSWSEPDFRLEAVVPTNWGSYIAELRDGRCGVTGVEQDDAIRPRLLETGFQVNLGPFVPQCTDILQASVTFDPPSIGGDLTTTTTVTVTGAVVGDMAVAMHELSGSATLAIKAIVTAPDTVTVYFTNTRGVAVNVGSAALRVVVFHDNTVGFSLNTLDDLYQFVAWY